MSAPPAARLNDPVAHSHALAGFVAGAVAGLAATLVAAVAISAVVGAVALEVGTAGLATPLIVGVAATAVEFGVTAYVGTKLTGFAEETGEALGGESMGAPSGKVAQGSANVFTNSRPAARAGDAETCDAGIVAQGSRTVFINGKPASRVGDKTSCGGKIVAGSGNVFIGGPPVAVAPIQSEVPEWVRWAAIIVGILPALGQAARAIGPALAEIEATGFARAAQTGAKALGRAMEERGGGARGAPVAASATADDAVASAASKLRSARTPAEVEDARNALKGLDYADRKTVLNDFANDMDVSTKPNTATFWSGGRMMPTGPGGEMEWNSARSWAEASTTNGRTTLEQTPGGGVLDKIDVFRRSDPLLKPADASNVWDQASARYTDRASGEVHAYLDNPRGASIYNTTERPAIMQAVDDGRVSQLKEFDIEKYHDWIGK